MANHTSFRIGGPADALVLPRSTDDLARLLVAAESEGIPVAVIGGGANLLVADAGVRGVVVCTSLLRRFEVEATGDNLGAAGSGPAAAGGDPEATGGYMVRVGAGLPVTELLARLLELGLSGLEFAAGLPGSVGGAVYMNARCYEHEIADLLDSVFYLDSVAHQPRHTGMQRQHWAYKRTPFMPGGTLEGAVVTGARFRLQHGDKALMTARMAELEADRQAKGHFDNPCAGSLFKNDRCFGRPTGQILDELGFRGRRIGDAMVSRKHANIFVNAGRASAMDMLALVSEAQAAAQKAFGFELEPEVVRLGDFSR
ncbi:MAG: UDP-N-acetylenolpyruvoylglucosamine reductase [Spirochaetes bacterium RIFOXYC1_FULL_54_7]|nr:MAG: UDP-N-acetylenolpyruvoylglucosamine reductase [Spirochaetes bacterium RIFOXYC1_FULL_54_7]